MKTWLKSYRRKWMIYYKKIDYDNFVNYIVFYAVMSVLDATKSNNVSVGKTSLYFISGISWPWRCVPIYIYPHLLELGIKWFAVTQLTCQFNKVHSADFSINNSNTTQHFSNNCVKGKPQNGKKMKFELIFMNIYLIFAANVSLWKAVTAWICEKGLLFLKTRQQNSIGSLSL